MSKRVFLTGASGFIGSHFLNHLLERTDWEIVCPVTFRHKGDSLRLDIDDFDPGRVHVVYHDLCGPISERMAAKLGDIDVIFSVAADSHVDRSITAPVPFIKNNVDIALTVLEYARLVKPTAFFQISTDETYGPAGPGLFHPEWSPTLPSNPYSSSKACQEAIAISYWRTYNVPVIITNTMNNFGERQDEEKFVPKVIASAVHGWTVPIHVDPATGLPGSRHYLHARNHADALLFLAENVIPGMFPKVERPDRYNVVGSREMDNLEMAQYVASLVGRELAYETVDAHSSRPGHDPRYALDGQKLHRLGWRPPIDFASSLARTVRWTLAHNEWLAVSS